MAKDPVAHLTQLGRQLTCPICLSLLKGSVNLSCNHSFCKNCLTESMRRVSNCPVCKVPATKREVRAAPHLDSMVEAYRNLEASAGVQICCTQPGDSDPQEGTTKTSGEKDSAKSAPPAETGGKGERQVAAASRSKKRQLQVPAGKLHVLEDESESNQAGLSRKKKSKNQRGAPSEPADVADGEPPGGMKDVHVPGVMDCGLPKKRVQLRPRAEGRGKRSRAAVKDIKTLAVDSEVTAGTAMAVQPEAKATGARRPPPGKGPLKPGAWTLRGCASKGVKERETMAGVVDDNERCGATPEDQLAVVPSTLQPFYWLAEREEEGEGGPGSSQIRLSQFPQSKLGTQPSFSDLKGDEEEEEEEGEEGGVGGVEIPDSEEDEGERNDAETEYETGDEEGDPEPLPTTPPPPAVSTHFFITPANKSRTGGENRISRGRESDSVDLTLNPVAEGGGKGNGRAAGKEGGLGLALQPRQPLAEIDMNAARRLGLKPKTRRALIPSPEEGAGFRPQEFRLGFEDQIQNERRQMRRRSGEGGRGGRSKSGDMGAGEGGGVGMGEGETSGKLGKRGGEIGSSAMCGFCGKEGDSEVSGKMVLIERGTGKVIPAKDQAKGGQAVHELCLEWAPNVYFQAGRAHNVVPEMSRAGRLKCCVCAGKGAALGCCITKCRRSYHFGCALEQEECEWDEENFVMLCPDHAKEGFPAGVGGEVEAGEGLVAAPLKITPTSKRCATPSHRSTPSLHPAAPHVAPKWAVGPAASWVMCGSGLDSAERDQLSALAHMTGGSITKHWTPAVTHVVAGLDEAGKAKRTLKLLSAILKGQWVVSPKWLSACLATGAAAAEQECEVQCDVHGVEGGSRRGRRRVRKGDPSLFEGLSAYFCGSYDLPPSKDDLAAVFSAGGGVVLHRRPLPIASPAFGESRALIFTLDTLSVDPSLTSNPSNETTEGGGGEGAVAGASAHLNPIPKQGLVVFYSDAMPSTVEGGVGSEVGRALMEKRREEAEGAAGEGRAIVLPHTWLLDSAAGCKRLDKGLYA